MGIHYGKARRTVQTEGVNGHVRELVLNQSAAFASLSLRRTLVAPFSVLCHRGVPRLPVSPESPPQEHPA